MVKRQDRQFGVHFDMHIRR